MKEIIMNSLDTTRIREKIRLVKAGNTYSPTEIEKLIAELNRAKIMEPKQIPGDVITMHSVVKVKYINNHKEFTLQLVYPEEANIKENKISIFAPIGIALLGYRKGDIIDWRTPGGNFKIKIEDIIYQPEAAGDFQL
jgi:regulator of nucleoside diphosphate kinase